MTMILMIMMIATETALVIGDTTDAKGLTKAGHSKRRLAVDAAEIGIYLLMLLFPHIDLSFRFRGLVLMLIVRLAAAAVSFLINRKNEKHKKMPSVVIGALTHMMLLFFALIPAFIFKDYTGRPVTGAHEVAQADAILIDSSRTETFEDDGSYREVPVHFFYPSDAVSIDNGSLPLVIFSHGAFGWYQSNTSTYMELASNGYVVASLDHPYHAMYTKDTSGKTIIVDNGFMQTAMTYGSDDSAEYDEAAAFEVEQAWMELRTADMSFVIDTLKKAADDHTFDSSWYFEGDAQDKIGTVMAMTDTTKIGLMGHSMGGATAVTVGRRGDISAVIDLDGTMLGEETGIDNGRIVVNDEPYPVPLLNIDNEDHHNSRKELREMGDTYSNNVILDNAVCGYDTYIKGTKHMNYTDLPLFSPFLAKGLGTGSIDPEECIDKTNALVLSFFDAYLKDSGTFAVQESY
ncbi:MAG: hypothetical protein IKR73_00895 [Oscillospiraceae bacterium]|nr:hypothetical protein [Oscillospiraceae bacterium]